MKQMGHFPPYLLGIDLGISSIGWTLINVNKQGEPASIGKSGVHTFEEGVEGDVESGRDKARGSNRRDARMARRMIWRRQYRRKKLLRLLQRAELLPPGEISSPQSIHEYLLGIDAQLRQVYNPSKDRVTSHVIPYSLRAKALDEKLDPYELGRAIYHLAQRRGFLSNRKSLKKDEDEGVVKQGISDLRVAIDSAEARTLGEYFAGLDAETEKIRRLWTARSMYIDEFNRVWQSQSPHHPHLLTESLKKEVFQAIFFQRPLKSAKHLIGRCELMPNARRAAIADRLFQEFRILQKVNDLVVIPENGPQRPLTDAERDKLLAALRSHGDLTFARIKGKSILGLPKSTTFNFEQRDNEKKLPGNRTDEKLREVFADRWKTLTDSQKDEIVLEIISFQNPDALARRAIKAWALNESQARALADTRLEQGYASHSRKALRMMIEHMKNGTQYATVRRELFPDSFESREPVHRLPPVLKWKSSLRNPAVTRALTELRKLVNEIVRVFGKPEQIRIELARDLKRGRKERERKSKEITAQTKLRDQARVKIFKEAGISEPRSSDIEKALLWEECGGVCPYTGRGIDFASLFGANPQFDIEHILPFSRSLDNSFINKTLCYHEENRARKLNRTPFEAYGQDTARYDQILGRVRRFQGKAALAKLRRFEMQQIPEDFVNRQLSDTRYASRVAADYLALLYGGRTDATGSQRVQVSTGGITAHLRREWLLNSILGQGEKNREDHRHHAVDAIAIALASPMLVARLQRAAEHASEEGRRLFARVPEPWVGFLEQARREIEAVNVSARQTKRIAGELHEGTNYSPEFKWLEGKKERTGHHVRKAVHGITASQANDIVDPIVRERVIQWLKAQPSGKPAVDSFPVMKTRDGREIPIKRARIRKAMTAVPIADGPRKRYVKPGANHHSVIVAVIKPNEVETKWEDYPVTRLEAHGRKTNGSLIIQRDWGVNRRFKFSLTANDYVQMKVGDNPSELCRLLSLSEGQFEFRVHTDARKASEARKAGSGARIRTSADELRKRSAMKVRITYLGDIVPAND